MTLDEAWAERQTLLTEAKEVASKAEALAKDRYPPPMNAKVSVWYGAIDAFYFWLKAVSESKLLQYEADTVWYESIKAVKGDVRIEWTTTDKGWDCKLATGEEFKA